MGSIRDKSGFYGKFCLHENHVQYKYLMSLDGTAAATPRFPLLLHSNSVVFKTMTNSQLWFFKALEPWIHYIPVKNDLTDLLSRLKWAMTHEQECKTISQNAQRLASEVLTHEDIYVYFYRLLAAYSSAQKEQY